MTTLRKKPKLTAVARQTQEDYPRNGTSVARIEEYITQVSEQIESKGTKKLSQEFSTTNSRILGALLNLEESFLHPQVQTRSGIVHCSGNIPEHKRGKPGTK